MLNHGPVHLADMPCVSSGGASQSRFPNQSATDRPLCLPSLQAPVLSSAMKNGLYAESTPPPMGAGYLLATVFPNLFAGVTRFS